MRSSPLTSEVITVTSNPKKSWKTKDLSEEAQVSLGQVSNVKKLLADREWVRTKPEGFVLTEPEALLLEWAENYKYQRNRVRGSTRYSKPRIEADLASSVAGEHDICSHKFFGSARIAPAVRQQRAVAYVKKQR